MGRCRGRGCLFGIPELRLLLSTPWNHSALGPADRLGGGRREEQRCPNLNSLEKFLRGKCQRHAPIPGE